MLIFDAETAPLPIDHILSLAKPFEAPPHPGDFDPTTVKFGNTKDADKRAQKVDEARQSHAMAVSNYDQDCARASASYTQDLIDNAALNPVHGRVIAVGYYSVEKKAHALDSGGDVNGQYGDETTILANFWRNYLAMKGASRKLVGSNIFGFDLPFLVRRSWILGVEVPVTVRNGRYWDQLFVDIRDVWLLGQQWGNCESSLDHMARVLAVGQKPEGVNGAMFWKLWSDPATRQQAIDYLVNDLAMTWGVCQRLGVV